MQAFEGFLKLVGLLPGGGGQARHVSNPADCSSAERCILK